MNALSYGSVCSGIEAATVAWHPLGWRPSWFAEIDTFPSKVLAHRFPQVHNHGDFTGISAAVGVGIDLLVGGTPCQSFSVAGLRGGLSDERGNLALEFLRLADRCAPRWVVWENVPGVLSSNGGRDFGSFLGALGELGYGWAYRVLDAQHFGVPQRRRRVFVVGCLGGWRSAGAVLFERAGVSGDPSTRGAQGTQAARGVAVSAGGGIAHALRGVGFDASEDGTGRDTPIVARTLTAHPGGRYDADTENFVVAAYAPIPFDTTQIASPHNRSSPQPGQPCHTLQAKGHPPALTYSITPETGQGADLRATRIAVAPTITATEANKTDRGVRVVQGHPPAVAIATPLTASRGGACPQKHTLLPTASLSVRRLTPRECERLQGFPDDWTAIPGAADGPRYKAIGNSMAVPVMRWIGERIQAVHSCEVTP